MNDHFYQLGYIIGNGVSIEDNSWMEIVIIFFVNSKFSSNFLTGIYFGRKSRILYIKKEINVEKRKNMYKQMEDDFLLDQLNEKVNS